MDRGAHLKDRYELREPLGQGGMGVVYRAYDAVLKCDVAVKTIREAPDRTALQLFYRECEVLVKLNHPNIVPILDIGEFEEQGSAKPYFVMPLLSGMPLDKLIRTAGTRLTAERRVEILSQVCRGLSAAHERGLVHRDLKPANVFVMPDYSAVIIDFGIAHIVNAGITGQKGTLYYMAPELIEGKPPSPASDIFALGVMAFELFTRRKPFEGATEGEIIEAILRESPPGASDVDPTVNQSVSRVIHKAMAKRPWHRFATAREFAECLEKAHRGEAIEYFDSAHLGPRIQRAKSTFAQGDTQFAQEIITELEAEGHLDPEIKLLRMQIDAATRQERVRTLLEAARSRFEVEEYPLALQKIQETLELDPGNTEALSLRAKIESTRSDAQIESWFRLVRQHAENCAFSHAREALQNILQIRPQDTRATGLLLEIERREQEYRRSLQEKERLYQAAVEAHQKGDLSSAITKLEQVIDMDRRAPDSQGRANVYQSFYNDVRSEYEAIRNAYAEARKHLDDRNFSRALAISDQFLTKYPAHALFQSLKFDAEEQQRLHLSAYIADIDRRVEAETDLERKVGIIDEAAERYPDETHFKRLRKIMDERLNLVSAIVAKARYHEENGQFNDSLGQWEILRTIHHRHPGLQLEIDRVIKRREQQARMESKARWAREIDACMEAGGYRRALDACRRALEESPGDGELQALAELARQGAEHCEEAQRLQARGEQLFAEGSFEEGLELLWQAHQLDARSEPLRRSLVDRLSTRAQSLLATDWRAAEVLIQHALGCDPDHAGAKGVLALLNDLKREEYLNQAMVRIRQAQASGDLSGAAAELQTALSFCGNEPRLLQLRATLETRLGEVARPPAAPQPAAGAAPGPAASAAGLIGATRILSRKPIPQPVPVPVAPQAAESAPAVVPESDAITGQSGTPERSRAPAAELHGVPGPHALGPARRLRRRALIPAIAVLVLAGSLTSWLLLRHRTAPASLEHKPVTEVTPVPGRAAAPALGELHIKVSPPSAEVTYGRVGETPQPASSSTLNLEEGTYVLSGRAPGYGAGSVTIPVAAGVTQTAELKLTPVKPIVQPPVKPTAQPPVKPVVQPRVEPIFQPPVEPIVQSRAEPIVPPPLKSVVQPSEVFQMDAADWEKPWTRDGEWFTRRGGDFVLYRRTPTAGTFQFTLRAKSKVGWVLDYSDPQNYLLFEINKQTFTSSQYTNNRRTVITDRKRIAAKTDHFTVTLAVEPTHVVTTLVDEQGTPVTLQDWNRPGEPFTRGRFGIHLPGSSQVWLANFTFTQARPVK
ncbi:MAG TPA: protein kinase [Bryobacteraceae bacterium]|nr:protein kinase [Bryobacteraceae bacterium]